MKPELERLTLPDVILTKKGDELEVAHKKTGGKAMLSTSRLNTWLVKVLREATQTSEVK